MDIPASAPAASRRPLALALNRAAYRVCRNWIAFVILASGAFVALPWLAPVFMRIGWTGAGRGVYTAYSFVCHQLPERSFFLFGPKLMLSLEDVLRAGAGSRDPFSLRQFIGTPQVGYKVGWSDRMVSMYSSIPLAALLWWALRKRVRPLPVWGFVLFTLPIVLDGASHAVSDLAGLGLGFRDSNVWLSALTGGSLPAWFYVGDALGSFNSWMRLLTGALFGIGLVWFAFAPLGEAFGDLAEEFEAKFARAGLRP